MPETAPRKAAAAAPPPQHQRPCPNCAHGQLSSTLYSVNRIPVHSVLLMATAQEAVSYRRGSLALACCQNCGFLTNTLFDPAAHEYSRLYEETQGFSQSFNKFLAGLAEGLINRYGIRQKRILEIGCGKGEFLVMMCEKGDNTGVGIDPSYVPERTSSPAAKRIKFIRDFYCRDHADLAADVICCRHTLEHIQPTRQFLQTIRQSIGDRRDVLVFFEVPDVLRVLKEGAFWDIYYEHCSYFSAGSLARLFRSEGFKLLELRLDYDQQYILLVAQVGSGGQPLELEKDLEQLHQAVRDFSGNVEQKVADWRKLVSGFAAAGQRTVIWGSGSKGVAFLTTLGLDKQVQYVVDINPYRQGKFMPGTGQRIVPPRFLAQYRPHNVIVMNPVYCQEIARDLATMELSPNILPCQ